MTREEILRRLNRRAVSRYGFTEEITDYVFGGWLEAKIVKAPDKHGRVREWTGHHYRLPLEVVRLKSKGVRSLDLIRLLLLLKGFDVPAFFDPITRRALKSAFVRLRNQMIGHMHSHFPRASTDNDPTWRKRKINERMGELDPALAEFVEYDMNELVDAYTLLRFGETSGTLNNAAERIYSGITGVVMKKLDLPEIPPGFDFNPNATAMFAGIFGNRDELENAEVSIEHATEKDFLAARSLFRLTLPFFQLVGAAKVGRTLAASWQWRIMLFLFLLHAIRQGHLAGLESA